MKIYRWIIGVLLVVFLIVTVVYIAYFYNENRSIENGTLIWRKDNVTYYDLC